jgi:hypothetical protein
MSGVYISASSHDRDVVDLYDQVYQQNSILAEITKPSEQAFKALITPDRTGGSILLFCRPVGRQEQDNLTYLIRHHLLPDAQTMNVLFRRAQEQKPMEREKQNELFAQSGSWRALCLPDTPLAAGRFISWCLEQGLFLRMVHYTRHSYDAACDMEIAPTGVSMIWEQIASRLA